MEKLIHELLIYFNFNHSVMFSKNNNFLTVTVFFLAMSNCTSWIKYYF